MGRLTNPLVNVLQANTLTKGMANMLAIYQKSLSYLVDHYFPCWRLRIGHGLRPWVRKKLCQLSGSDAIIWRWPMLFMVEYGYWASSLDEVHTIYPKSYVYIILVLIFTRNKLIWLFIFDWVLRFLRIKS